MSDEFQKYMNQKSQLTKTFYDHHKLQPKISKRKQLLKFQQPRKINNHMISEAKDQLSNHQTNVSRKLFSKTMRITTKSQLKSSSIGYGRDIFKKQIGINKNLGPGQYNPSLLRSRSFGYIHKQQQKQSNPLIDMDKFKQDLLGPGKYKYQQNQNHLSKHKSQKGIKFASEKLIRCILPQNNVQKINLCLNEEAESRKQVWRRKLGPGSYKLEKDNQNNSKFQKTQTYSISMTERSSLVSKQSLLGPGYYEWSKYFQNKKINGDKTKPKVQFKFVHGNQ